MTLNKQLINYFILAYFVTCLLWTPLFLNALDILSSEDSSPFLIIGAFGPMISALIITFKVSGFSGCTKLLKKLFKFKIHYKWYLSAFIIPIIIVLIVFVLIKNFADSNIDIVFEDPLEFLAGFFVILLIVPGEEIGWRGFALPRLQKKYSALTASIILGVLWSIIHFPLFFVQAERAAGLNFFLIALGFILLIVFFTIIYTFLFNGTQGSILIVCIFHASMNVSNNLYKSPNHDYDILAMYLFLIITFILASVIIFKYGFKNLSSKEKVIDF